MAKTWLSFWLVLLVTLLGNAAALAESPLDKRQALAHTMADLVISTLRDTKKSDSDRKASLEQGFANVMDLDWIAKFVLGNGWRNATDEQRQRYTALYRRYLTRVYVEHYAETSDRKVQNIKVLGINDNSNGTYIARTSVVLVDGHNMKVDYLVRESENSNRIIDVVIEGVSLLATHRADFSTLAASKGIDAVIAKLEGLVNAPSAISLSMK